MWAVLCFGIVCRTVEPARFRVPSQAPKKCSAEEIEAELIFEYAGRKPVVLLDDVFSELDEVRQKCLVKNFKDNQVINTTSGIELVGNNHVVKNLKLVSADQTGTGLYCHGTNPGGGTSNEYFAQNIIFKYLIIRIDFQ